MTLLLKAIVLTLTCTSALGSEDLYEKGRAIIISSCLGCHSLNSQVAPSFQEISSAYRSKAGTLDSTMLLYQKFLVFPVKGNVVLKKALQDYGEMPILSISRDDAKDIAYYLTKSNLDDLDLPINRAESTPVAKGKLIASSTKTELGQNLMKAIKKGKTVGAIDFCNEKAMPITDDHMKKSGASIKRATDRPRNPRNLADVEEAKYLLKFKSDLVAGKMPEPVLLEAGDEYHFYSPIITNTMCLQCHGTVGKDISSEVLDKIAKKYPNDKAIGYKENELRGIFSVRWKLKSQN